MINTTSIYRCQQMCLIPTGVPLANRQVLFQQVCLMPTDASLGVSSVEAQPTSGVLSVEEQHQP